MRKGYVSIALLASLGFAAAAGAETAGVAPPAVWTFRDVALDDGGSISGHFTWTPATSHVSNWSVWATGGNEGNFPIFEYRPDNSSIGQGSGGEIEFFVAATGRQVTIRPSGPLSGTPVLVALDLANASFSAVESIGAAPARLITTGALFTDPAPTRVRWFFEGVTLSDGGTLVGYADVAPDDGTILKWALRVAGGDETSFPPMTYTPADSNGSIFNAAVFGPQNVHDLVAAGIRHLRWAGEAPTRQDGGRIAFYGPSSVECYNCSPYRPFATGVLRGVTDELWGDGFE